MLSRRLLLAPVLAGLLLVTASCTNPFAPSSGVPDSAAVAPEVKTSVEQYAAKVNARDAIGAGEFYAEDPGFHWVEDGRTVYQNRAEAITGLTNFLAGFSESHFEVYDIKIVMLDDDCAVATSKFTQTIAANAQASLKFEGVVSFAMAKRDGTWKIVSGHKSANALPH
ncbi:MAG: nuclear transport factor 2 family protein [Alphaproteobacteria bacterium]|nr:nuclear transport factor 2 family protein [Alphaproteobacteria bacterium]